MLQDGAVCGIDRVESFFMCSQPYPSLPVYKYFVDDGTDILHDLEFSLFMPDQPSALRSEPYKTGFIFHHKSDGTSVACFGFQVTGSFCYRIMDQQYAIVATYPDISCRTLPAQVPG